MEQDSHENMIIYNLYHPNHFFVPALSQFGEHTPWEFVLESELLKCENTVWADTECVVNEEFEYLQRFWLLVIFVETLPINLINN